MFLSIKTDLLANLLNKILTNINVLFIMTLNILIIKVIKMNDKELIERLGGVAALSKFLDMDYQRVFNWTKRGIPAQVKLDNPKIFLTNNPKPLKVAESV